jgi:crossover junction endodeoxyribonuclease RuvC
VLGVDPGLSRCGVGMVDGPSFRPVAVRAGVITTPADDRISRRLARLHDELSALLATCGADEVAVERVFFNVNVRTATASSQAAGIVLLCAEQAGLPVTEYTPTQVKSAVTGEGNAGKEQVQFMVRATLRLSEPPRPADAADALAVALCHLQLARTAAHR